MLYRTWLWTTTVLYSTWIWTIITEYCTCNRISLYCTTTARSYCMVYNYTARQCTWLSPIIILYEGKLPFIILRVAMAYYYTARGSGLLLYCTWQWPLIILHVAMAYYYTASGSGLLLYCTCLWLLIYCTWLWPIIIMYVAMSYYYTASGYGLLL